MNEEISVKVLPPTGESCPFCFFGYRNDGQSSWTLTEDGGYEFKFRQGTKCEVCKGKGRVKVSYTPID